MQMTFYLRNLKQQKYEALKFCQAATSYIFSTKISIQHFRQQDFEVEFNNSHFLNPCYTKTQTKPSN